MKGYSVFLPALCFHGTSDALLAPKASAACGGLAAPPAALPPFVGPQCGAVAGGAAV